MSMYPSISIAGSGLVVDQTWLDVIGGNVANADDVATPGRPVYRPEEVVAEAVPSADGAGAGVAVVEVAASGASGTATYDPSNPLADRRGMVVTPAVSIGHELVALVEAQASYEANATVLQHADTAYKAILDIHA
ncbi:MAG TPA: flagellar basal body rod C-terminal domain-containing protein [Acidimicrobiales bacterium]|nr:flagellar basal body rod C-terminal domain-containing protein [Acidimicrobiales bacterium]